MKTLLLAVTILLLVACDGKLIDVRAASTAGAAGETSTDEEETGKGGSAATGGARHTVSGKGGSPASGGATSTVPGEGGAQGESTGSGGAEPETDGGAAGTSEVPDTAAECIANSSIPTLVGTWSGESHWGPLTLVVTGASENGGVCGTLTFGDVAAPPPPTDPNIGWPPSFRDNLTEPNDWGVNMPTALGYPYPIVSHGVVANRMLFSIDWNLAWEPWCRLQSPAEGSSMCLPHADYDPGSDECMVGFVSVDCAWNILCTSLAVCECSAEGCTLTPRSPILFDLSMGSDTAVGTIEGRTGWEESATTTLKLARASSD